MKNVFHIFKRDYLRLFKAPAALVVVAALIILPSLYTWLNVVGFWNPYENTSGLRVCVVNEDKGASSDITGDLALGDQIVQEMKSNTQLGWVFTDRETAMEEVRSGAAYAAFIIPEDFSHNLTTLFSDNFTQPALEYYVNEKLGAVAPKITDTGATMLDETINSTFVSTVSSLVASVVNDALTSEKDALSSAKSDVSLLFAKVRDTSAEAQRSIMNLCDAVNWSIGKTSDAQNSLDRAKDDITLVSNQLGQIAQLTVALQNDLGLFATQTITVLGKGSIFISQAAAQTNTTIGQAASSIAGAQVNVDAALETGQTIATQNALIIEKLETMLLALPDTAPEKALLGDIVASLKTQNTNFAQTLTGLETISSDMATAASSIATASNAVNTAVQTTTTNTQNYLTLLSTSTLPLINNSLASLARITASLATTVSSQSLIIDQAQVTLEQLAATLDTTSSALNQTGGLLTTLDDDLETIETDLLALGTSGVLSQLFSDGKIDASKIADFMLSPTKVETQTLYKLEAYGSAMAPLFSNLTLWIGVFMLMVILKQEVDGEGIKKLRIWQRYFGRWLFLAPLAALQAIVCCAGNLIIGVQAASVPLYFLTAIIASLTYLSIQFALSVTMQHIGKGLCVVLVFVQIPGATGLYPIEMTPDFFQALYPFFPFTYGINAMRETIAGFYGTQWLQLIGTLLVFLVVAFLAGLLARPYFTNLNRMFAKQIAQSDILYGEKILVPERRFRWGQLISALSDKEEYRTRLQAHAERFLRWYPRFKRGALIIGIIVPALLIVVFSLAESEKVIVLSIWLVWLIVIIGFLVLVEHARDSLERQSTLENLSDDELRALFMTRSSLDEDEIDEETNA